MLSFLGGLLFLISTLSLMNGYSFLNSWLHQDPMSQFHCFPLSWILSLNESRYNGLLLVKICWQLTFTEHASYASSQSEARGAFWLVDGWGAEALGQRGLDIQLTWAPMNTYQLEWLCSSSLGQYGLICTFFSLSICLLQVLSFCGWWFLSFP